MLERSLKRGVEGILVIACGDADPVAGDGCQWFEQRMNGRRQPAFDPGKADASRVRLVHLDRTQSGSLARVAREVFQRWVRKVRDSAPSMHHV